MRLRVTLAAVVLGLAVASASLARQQPGDSPRPVRGQGNAPPQAALGNLGQLRAQVAQLRAEVELGEIEHEVNKGMLSLMMKQIEEAHWKETSKAIQPPDGGVERAAEHQRTALRVQKQDVGIEVIEADVQQVKARFRQRAIKLHEMKFALADLEERLTNHWSR